MDYKRTYPLFLRGLWTDLELNLDDGFQSLTLHVHKIVMIAHSQYFEKLLMFDELLSKTTLKVPDVSATHSIILSFYGQEIKCENNWSQQLSLAKCRDYFGLETILPTLPLEIEPEDYDTILELCGIVGFDKYSIKVLTDNLPLEYDLSKLSKELVAEMIKSGSLHVATCIEDNRIKLYDVFTSECVYTMTHDEKISKMCYSKDRKFFATIDIIHYCCIWSAFDTSIIYKDGGVVAIDFSHSNIHFAMAYGDYGIKIYDLLQQTICLDMNTAHKNIITYVKFSFCGRYLASGSIDKNLKIWNVANGQLLYKIESTIEIKKINFTKDTLFISVSNEEYRQKIWRIKNNSIDSVEALGISNHDYRYWEMSADDVCMAVKYDNGISIVEAKTNFPLNFIYNTTYQRILFSPNHKYIALRNSTSIDLYEIAKGTLLHSFSSSLSFFSPNYKYFVVGLAHKLQIFNLITHAYYEYNNKSSGITAFGFIDDKNDVVIYQTRSNEIELYNISTKKIINIFSAKLYFTSGTRIYNRNALRLLEIIE